MIATLLVFAAEVDSARLGRTFAYIVIALIVIGLAKWLFFPARKGRPCPRCGHDVKAGVLDCPHCGFDFRTV